MPTVIVPTPAGFTVINCDVELVQPYASVTKRLARPPTPVYKTEALAAPEVGGLAEPAKVHKRETEPADISIKLTDVPMHIGVGAVNTATIGVGTVNVCDVVQIAPVAVFVIFITMVLVPTSNCDGGF